MKHVYSSMNNLTRRAMISGSVASVALAMSAPRSWAGTKLDVVATTGMIADAARTIGNELVQVKGLMGAGVDPHAYRQTRSDIVAMTRADLVLWHGLYLEAQMERFLEDLAGNNTVIPVAEKLSKDILISHEDYEGRFDPHVWMDPQLWSQVVDEVHAALATVRPDAKPEFDASLSAFHEELVRLDDYARGVLSNLDPAQRVLVTAHDAFGYFGTAYDFEVIGIQGISTEGEAGLNRISELVNMLVERDIRAVFVETSVSDRNMRALIEGAEARGHEVSIGGSLFSDAMGPDGTYEGTYLGMIDHNVTTIARALGANAPQGGRLGKLAVSS